MQIKNRMNKIVATAILILMMISAAFLVFSSTNAKTVPAQITSIPSNMLQYEWPSAAHDPERTYFNPGPGPTAANIKWKTKIANASGYPVAFNGMVFVGNVPYQPIIAPGTKTYALDGGTGQIVWVANLTGSIAKIDNTYMMIGNTCVRIADGTTVWVGPAAIGSNLQAFSYGVGYVPELKMFMPGRFGGVAYSLPDPSKPPTVAWNITDQLNIDIGFPVYGGGKLFLGSNDGFLKAFNATTGAFLWKAPASSMFFYSLCYYDGKVYHGGLDNNVRCWDASTGKLLWTYNPQTWYGQWSMNFAAAHGMIYGKNQDTYLYAINATTGKLVWRQKGPGVGYSDLLTVAGDKIYNQMGEYQYRDFETGEYAHPEYCCYDAFTGKLLWVMSLENSSPSNQQCNAYGNLYIIPTRGSPAVPGYWSYGGGGGLNEVWCISSEPIDWAMFMKDPQHSAEGAGPTNLAVKWKFTTGAQVYSSPTLANGVAYFGSLDSKIYAVDANTGTKKWNFTTGFPVVSSQAVVNGKLYTGADDGNIYCLNATTGTKLWQTPAGGITKNILWNGIAVVQCRSSPMVVGGKVYVGSLDGNLYCLDANSGTVLWKFPTQGPIYVAPAVVDNAVYFPSTRGGYPVGWGPTVTAGDFYKLNATSGSVIWHKEIPYVLNRTTGAGNFLVASPTVAQGMVFVRNGFYQNFALNATTGETIWTNLARFNVGTRTQWGGVIQINAPLYAYGLIYMNDYYGVVCLNATTGKEQWFAWLSRENISPALAYAYGRVYTVNELGVIYVLDALTGEKLSYYELGAYQMHGAPSLYNGNLYVGCYDMNVYCFGEARLMSAAASQASSSMQGQATSVTSVSTVSTPIVACLAVIGVAVVAVAAILLKRRK